MEKLNTMRDSLTVYLEENFSFEPFNDLSLTRSTITENPGTIQYIPTHYPLPLSKRALSAIINTDSTIRVLPMPATQDALHQTLRNGLEYLLENEGDASVVFFCPTYLEAALDTAPGSGFVPIQKLSLKDKHPTLQNVFNRLTGLSLTTQFNNLSEFILTSYFSATIGDEIDPANLAVCHQPRWDFYVDYRTLQEDDPLSTFYLQSLSIQNIDQFWDLPDHARKNVYEVLFQETYGQSQIDNCARFHKHWTSLSQPAQNVLRTLVIEEAINGRFFNSRISELASDWNRSLAEELQDAYPKLISDESGSLSVRDPQNAARQLRDFFGIIWANATPEEIRDAIASARSRFDEDAVHIKEYSPDRAKETLSRIDEVLLLFLEAEIATDEEIVATAFSEADWQAIFTDLYRTMLNKDLTGYLTANHIKQLSDARRRVELEQSDEADAQQLSNRPASLDTLTDFLRDWTDYIITEYGGNSGRTTVYRDAILEKYEEYCDTLIKEYPQIKKGSDYEHISELLTPDSDTLRIFLVIDSLGYTDFEFMQQWEMLNHSPDVEPVFSNIPSYTPSAMTSILSGLPATESGIYHWTAKHGDELCNLKWGHDTDAFDWVTTSTDLSYELIQKDSLNKSGVTRFSQEVADITLSGNFAPGDTLDDLQKEIVDTVDTELAQRNRTYTDDDIRQEHRRDRLQAQKSDFVVYISEFDEYLHKNISTFEFQNYYSALARFIDAVSEGLLDALSNHAVDGEPTEFVICADHGKITRQEQELFADARSLEQFRQADLVERLGSSLLTQYELRLDKAPFTNKNGKYPLGVGNVDESILLKRAYDVLDKTASEEGPNDIDDVSDEDIKTVIESKPAVISASKFLFGWTKGETPLLNPDQRMGIDLYQPETNAEFDPPSVGLLSRYQTKNTGRAHGYHGGTSISEMTAAKLTFPGDKNA